MRNHTLIAGILVLGLALFAGCNGTTGVKPAGGGESNQFPDATQKGDTFLGGKLKVESIQPPGADGVAVYTVRNLAGEPLKYLTGSVLFFYDPPAGGIAKIASEASIQGFDIFKDETFELRGAYTRSEELRSMQLRVEQVETAPGITFLGGGLKCIDVKDQLPTSDPHIAFSVQNVAGRPLENVRFKVVLLHRTSKVELTESRWKAVPGGTIPAGQTMDLQPRFKDDISAFGYPIAVLQIKQSG